MHFVAQESPTQPNGAHDLGATTWHPPSPSQTAPGVPISSTHSGMPHDVSLPTRLVQAVALVPSHWRDVQMLFGSDCAQAGRVPPSPAPTGAPVIVTQVPTLPYELQAWHCPEQAELQQTASTQN